ncbi:diguanylate cyclase [Allohahella marinimesophila]|uniref:diguanylate cyclase n=1 Tax=Allohahella marinimesophila TaxID=1054972 RepID=A0ABP7PN69_9GAMM
MSFPAQLVHIGFKTSRLYVGLLLLVCLSFSSLASAVTPVVDRGQGAFDLSGHVSYFTGASSEFTVNDMSTGNNDVSWQAHQSEGALSLRYQTEPAWVRIALINEQTTAADYVIEVAWPLIPSLDFYLVTDDGVLHQASGQLVEEALQPLAHRNELFPFQLAAGQAGTVYMRVVSDGTILLPLYLWSQAEFFEYDSSINLLLGLFFGAMGVMALYNLSLALLTRDKPYLSYVLYVIALAAFQANVTGVGGLYLWPDWLEFRLMSYGITSGLGFTAATIFTIQFLELRKSPWLYRISVGILFFWVAVVLMTPFFSKALLGALGFPMGLASCVFAWAAAAYLAFKGHRSALYFVIAWSFLIVGASLYIASMAGIVPRTPVTEYAQAIGSLIEVVLLSFALAERINRSNAERVAAQSASLSLASQLARERAEKIEAQEQAIAVQAQATEVLEAKVKERTQALSKLNSELEKASQTDPLTGISNRRHFEAEFARLLKICNRAEQSLTLMFIDADHFKQINDVYGHAAGDECLRQLSACVQQNLCRAGDLFARFGGEEFVVAMPMTSPEVARSLAEKIKLRIAELRVSVAPDLAGKPAQVCRFTVSMGIAGWVPQQDETSDKLLKAADAMLYRAKDSGRNRIDVWSAS